MSTSVTALANPTEESASQQLSGTPLVHAKTKRKSYPQTDAGNAELFAELNSSSLRYDHRRSGCAGAVIPGVLIQTA